VASHISKPGIFTDGFASASLSTKASNLQGISSSTNPANLQGVFSSSYSGPSGQKGTVGSFQEGKVTGIKEESGNVVPISSSDLGNIGFGGAP
jgi:hypothetical protein